MGTRFAANPSDKLEKAIIHHGQLWAKVGVSEIPPTVPVCCAKELVLVLSLPGCCGPGLAVSLPGFQLKWVRPHTQSMSELVLSSDRVRARVV